ncbi:two-component system, NtrC family, nitrogen regulation sensor histidine kinase NtrY [Tenacibaculum sp. 190524A02b]|uniref:histidine kinase n=1 Tax=Tenacibaculum vairaonense TaxID=3137860 RepID=A0ABM9PRF2_9FLAO
MGKTQYIQIINRVILIATTSIIIFYCYTNTYIISTIVFILFLGFQIFLLIDFIQKLFADIEKSIDCLLYDDYSNTISLSKRKNPLHDKTARLIEKHRQKSLLKSSEDLIFTNIIESLSIGVLILRKNKENTIEVFQLNNAFVEFLKIPKFYNWNLLQSKIGDLNSFISKWKEIKHTVALSINDKKETFILKTSVTQTNEFEYLVISLETIEQLINKKEKEAWYKLMNVMSHEIINTITPISSLAENLDSLLLEDFNDEDMIEELSHGLKIIKRRSHHLTSFVDTYRKLAELPLPNKEKFDLKELVNNTLSLLSQEFTQKGIIVKFNHTNELHINADKKQIEQVIINLLSNCIYALEETKNPMITIKIANEKNRLHLIIKDNGIGISKEIQDNIFIPYFTTRKDGSGIGLTLSKSIIEAHNGSIYFTSEKGITSFKITFIK